MFRASILATLLAASPLLAQEQREPSDLARLLPAETPFYVEVQNPTPDEMAKMAYFRCLQDPQLKALMKRLFGTGSALTTSKFDLGPARITLHVDMSQPDVAINVAYADARGKRTFRMSEHFMVSWLGLAPGQLPVDLVAAIQVDSDPASAVETIKRMIAAGVIAASHRRKGRRPPVDAMVKRMFRDVSHRDIAFTEATIDQVKLYLAPIGKLIVFATTKPRMIDLLDRYRDRPAESLASDGRYRAMHDKAGGTGTASTVIYLQIDRTLDAIGMQEPQGASIAKLFLGQVGLGGLRSFTSVSRADGAGVTSTTEILVDGPRRGLAQLFEAGATPTMSCLEFAPKDSLYATTGSFDLPGMYSIALQLGGMMVSMGQTKMEELTGLRLRKDILDTLGREAGLIVSTNRGLIPDIALVLKVKDPDRLEKSILHLLSLADWKPGTGPVPYQLRGGRVYTIPLAHLEIPLAPTFGMVDGHLVITPFPMSFQRFVSVKKGDRPSLAENRDFMHLSQRVPEGALGISYLDLARVFELVYDTGIPLLQAMPPHPGMNAHYELPDVDVFSRHLYGRVAWRTGDDKGVYWHSHSAMDTGAAFLGLMGAGVGAYTAFQTAGVVRPPPTQVTRGRDPEARLCRDRVQMLRTRIMFRIGEKKKLPGSLEELKAPHDQPNTFIVPGHDKPYVYLGPKGKGGILLHGYPNGKDGRICVITTKLRPDRITEAELKRRLESAPARGPR